MRGFATGVGSKADIGAPPLTQLSFMSTRPNSYLALLRRMHNVVDLQRRRALDDREGLGLGHAGLRSRRPWKVHPPYPSAAPADTTCDGL